MRRRSGIALASIGLVAIAIVIGSAGWYRHNDQRPDASFDTSVAHPAYARAHPRVAIDAAHHNFHRASGRYRPLASLLVNDGYRVSESSRPFDSPGALDSVEVLVIANASGWWLPRGGRAARPAFTPAEVEAVRRWVEGGGSLLLVADHYPLGAAAARLASVFGVEMRGGYLLDERNQLPDAGSASWILYDSANAGLGEHPILVGRDGAERVRRVVAFTGQSLSIPPGATALLRSDTSALEVMPGGSELPAAGRAQAVAIQPGRGRVVVVGEAAMLTAQVTGGGRLRFGMSWPGTDDRQLALNIFHWLSRAL